MAFQNSTNLGRVDKMIETLRLIEKSAASNRATPDEICALLSPLLEAMSAYFVERTVNDRDQAAVSGAPETRGLSAGERAALHLADGASLRQLIAALIARLDAHADRLAASSTDT